MAEASTHLELSAASLIEDVDHARASLYALLSALLAQSPEAATLARLSTLQGNSTPVGQAFEALAVQASRIDAEAAAREYDVLFIGLVCGELLPYASYYRTGFLQGRPLAQLRATLHEIGVERAPGRAEPEDHAATVLEVMAGMAAGRLGQSAEMQVAFFRDHVAPWMGQFFADVESAPSATFYATVGTIGRVFIEIEASAFAMGPAR